MPWRASCPGNIQSLGDGSGPLGSILGCKTEDEVYADVVESGIFEYAVGLNGSGGIVTAVHPFQDPVIERLHPHTDTVYTHLEQGLGIFRPLVHYVLRIGFNREFFKRACQITQMGDNMLQ